MRMRPAGMPNHTVLNMHHVNSLFAGHSHSYRLGTLMCVAINGWHYAIACKNHAFPAFPDFRRVVGVRS